jgi:hypothetical protein
MSKTQKRCSEYAGKVVHERLVDRLEMDVDRNSRSIVNMRLRRETLLPDARLAFFIRSATEGSSNVDRWGGVI